VNQQVGMQISILQGSANGAAVFIETHNAPTNANGLVSIEVGGGTAVLGSINGVNWANGPYFIKTETDPAGGSNYTITGTSQLLSVPYAMYAAASGSSIPGPQGPAGATGATGPQGPAGNDGATGPQGPAGATGPQGITGATGAQGPIGNTGANGPQGPQGPAGATGPQGTAGAQGAQGTGVTILGSFTSVGQLPATGAAGDSYLVNGDLYVWSTNTLSWSNVGNIQGPAGVAGPQGTPGPTGLTGATGPAGATGPQGAQGSQGLTGPQGPIGLTGPQGAAGTNGTNGAVGASGPQGATGPQGPAGANGTNGTNGVDGKTVLNGTSNPTALIGSNGDFYINTITNTIFGPKATGAWPTTGVSLLGPQGATGSQGLQGPTGATGPQGPIGLTGATGAAGTNGINGAVGATGPQGATGATGAQGPIGPQGLLSNGSTAGNTPYWNGSTWVVNNSNVHNNGAGVGIGTSTPNASAKLEVASTIQGFLPPRMTSAQRNSIPSPATGLIIYNTTTNCLNFFVGIGWNESCGTPILPAGSITGLNCGIATNNGTLISGTALSGVSSLVPYTGGNGGTHSGQTVTSTGVIGLTASLAVGTFANGIGSLTYTITGTPSASGTASFALNIGGQSCNLNLNVVSLASLYPANSVFCNGPTVIVEATNPATGRIWMDRNLGATQAATSSTDANSYGDLYQWGRRSDGHQCRTSPTTNTFSSTDTPANGNFILAPNSPFDWRSPQNTNLWQGVNGINNPCPTGYRLPTDIELNTEQTSWSSNNSSGAWASPLKLPTAGYRFFFNGSLAGVGTDGLYWSSTVNGLGSSYLDITSGNAILQLIGYRASGISVRCLKD
jgi:hypothetical protein